MAKTCPGLPSLTGKRGKDILPWATKVAHMYADCKQRHAALVRAWPSNKEAK